MRLKFFNSLTTPSQDTVILSMLRYGLGPRSGSDIFVSFVKTEVN